MINQNYPHQSLAMIEEGMSAIAKYYIIAIVINL
jgi:hypothetical protein